MVRLKGRRKKEYVSVSTQTSPIKPLVKLTRLTSDDIEKYTSRCIPMKEAMELSKQQLNEDKQPIQRNTNNVNSIIRRINTNPLEIQALPNTYQTFIRPINNNENANSTFDASIGNVNYNEALDEDDNDNDEVINIAMIEESENVISHNESDTQAKMLRQKEKELQDVKEKRQKHEREIDKQMLDQRKRRVEENRKINDKEKEVENYIEKENAISSDETDRNKNLINQMVDQKKKRVEENRKMNDKEKEVENYNEKGKATTSDETNRNQNLIEKEPQKIREMNKHVNNNYVNVMRRKINVNKLNVIPEIPSLIMRDFPLDPPILPELSIMAFTEFGDTSNLRDEEEYEIRDQGTQTEQEDMSILDKNIGTDDNDKSSDIYLSDDIDIYGCSTGTTNNFVAEDQVNNRHNKPVRFKTINISTMSDNSSISFDCCNNNGANNNNNNRKNSKNSEKYKKYIRITANNVHIHNHFYK